MILLRNLALFFVVFLPASCATGWAAGFLDGPMTAPRLNYPLAQVFMMDVLPLLLPTLIAVPLLHVAFRYGLRGRTPATARTVAMIATPIALLVVHMAFYGKVFVGVPLLVMVGTAGALFGAIFATNRRTDERG